MTMQSGPLVSLPRVAMTNDPRIRGVVYQVLLLALIVWLGVECYLNAQANLQAQRIATGFGFLENTAGFGVNQTLIPYQEADTYGRVFVVGLLNTLLVAVLGIVLATVIGFAVGIGRLSSNWLVARLASAYVEVIRNQPLLFQILFWYLAVLGAMPSPRQSFAIGWQPVLQGAADGLGVLQRFGLPGALADGCRWLAEWVGPPGIYLNNRGLVLPELAVGPGGGLVVATAFGGLVVFIGLRIWAKRRQTASGQSFPLLWAGLGLIVGLPLLAFVALGAPATLTPPVLRGFNFASGVRVIPEFVALLIALSTYTAAFIAEIVRAGIEAVSRGQTEAAYSLGLSRNHTLRFVVIPQAMRVIVPPLTSQYLNLTKNSSLAVGIGYPDLFAVFAGTALNQTGQAIEILAMTMAVYLVLSLVTSALMNWYNARLAIKEG
jgi:general L-amino acid transport system permease protein